MSSEAPSNNMFAELPDPVIVMLWLVIAEFNVSAFALPITHATKKRNNDVSLKNLFISVFFVS